jgi:hypothetical protein
MMVLFLPQSDCYIQRNIFRNFGGLATETGGGPKIYITNNLFYRDTKWGGSAQVSNFLSFDGYDTIAEFNTFPKLLPISVNEFYVQYPPKLSLSDNYWGVSSRDKVERIFGRNIDYIWYMSFLTNPDAATPVVGIVPDATELKHLTAISKKTFSHKIKVANPLGHKLKWSVSGVEGLTVSGIDIAWDAALQESYAVIRWRPNVDQAGYIYPVVIKAFDTDSGGELASMSLSISVINRFANKSSRNQPNFDDGLRSISISKALYNRTSGKLFVSGGFRYKPGGIGLAEININLINNLGAELGNVVSNGTTQWSLCTSMTDRPKSILAEYNGLSRVINTVNVKSGRKLCE